jgi:hypothetical protein
MEMGPTDAYAENGGNTGVYSLTHTLPSSLPHLPPLKVNVLALPYGHLACVLSRVGQYVWCPDGALTVVLQLHGFTYFSLH